tara:strand:- start:779 stop:1261 length:483 start_codon:yes stop_codon:yes gene_type:complete
MRTPQEIRSEIEERIAQFSSGATIIFDVGPDIYLACDIFRVVRVAPIYAEDGSVEAVHWFLGYNPTFHTSSHYGAARVVKVLGWNWVTPSAVDLELDGSVMRGAKKMRIELLQPETNPRDVGLMNNIEEWRKSASGEIARTEEMIRSIHENHYEVIIDQD